MSSDAILELLKNLPFFILAIFGLGLSIFVHELGHFLAARKRGLHVTRFSIGMGPKIVSWVRDDVEYRISALPIGGYVALPQLADMGRLEGGKEGEFADEEALPPISFSDKVIVAVMGAVFNFIFAFLLALIIWWTGQPSSNEMLTTKVGYVTQELSIDGVSVPGPAYVAGLKPGDVITRVDGASVETFSDIHQKILTGFGKNKEGEPEVILEILRDEEPLTLTVNPAIAYYNSLSKDPIRTIGIAPADKIILHTVTADSPAESAGLLPGDHLISANGIPIHQLQTFVDIISDKTNTPTELLIERGGGKMTFVLDPVTVALTKPTLKLRFQRSGLDSTMTVRPDFGSASTANKTDPSSKASLKVHQIVSDKGGSLSKIKREDRIIAVKSKAVDSLESLQKAIENERGPLLQVTVGRSGRTMTVPIVFSNIITEVTPPYTQPMVGFSIAQDTVVTHVGPFKQFGEQIAITFRILQALFHRDSEIGIGHLSGPIGIVRQLTEITRMDFRLSLSFLILMNVNLGILNLLPIPILDGGHILFAIIAKIRRKALPVKIVASLQGAFMLMLFSIMIYVVVKDSVRWKGDSQQLNEAEIFSKLRIDPVFVDDK